jgi:6-phosphogluconolactonase
MRATTLNKSTATLQIYNDASELADAAARHFAALANQYISASGRFTVALSGGSTPKRMFSILAGEPFANTVPWASIYFFWGDERCVPPDHPDSNYRTANETLLAKVSAPRQNIFRIPAEEEDHETAAAAYSDAIRKFFSSDSPRFDLVFLGMGPDGHTASLFPQTKALQINDKIAVPNYVEKFQAYRITLTAATINNARNIAFLVAGEDKAEALREVLEGEYRPETYPSQLIKPVDGSLVWMVDEAAAVSLS